MLSQADYHLAAELLRENVLVGFKAVQLYRRLLRITTECVPSMELSPQERSLFRRWARRYKLESPIHSFEDFEEDLKMGKRQFDALKDMVARKEDYEVDGVPVTRLWSLVGVKDKVRVGAEDSVHQLEEQLQRNPHDGQAWYELALHMMVELSLSIESLLEYSEQAKYEGKITVIMKRQEFSVVMNALSKALALKLDDLVHTAALQFSYGYMLGWTVEQLRNPVPRNRPQALLMYKKTALLLYLLKNQGVAQEAPRSSFWAA